jgi:hypothetical protein
MAPAQVAVTPSVARIPLHPIPFFHRIWPVAVVGVALAVNVLWMGFLGFGFIRLIF